MQGTTGRRRPASILLELRAPAEFGLFLGAMPLLHAAPRGRSRPVLVMPGFAAGDTSTLPLRLLLAGLGHQPMSWGLGTNLGPTESTITGMVRRLHQAVDACGQPVPLIGWSLGGVYGRVLAQWYPDLVDQVISLGSPFNIGRNDQTSLDPLYDWMDRRHRFVGRRGDVDLDRIPCPSSAVYTRTDGVVAWESCRQTSGEQAENIEVRGSHCGLGVNVAVAYAIADRLTRSRDNWRPFDAPPLLRALFPGPPCAN